MNIFSGKLQLKSQTQVARDTIQYFFEVEAGQNLTQTQTLEAQLPYIAGQFINLEFGPKDMRSYSIASTPDKNQIELLIRLIPGGMGSEHLRRMQVGDTVGFKGPFGHFMLSENPEAQLVFCGTGTGIAPLKGLIEQEAMSKNPRPMTLLYGGRNVEDIAYIPELQSWATNLNIKLGLSQDPQANQNHSQAQHCRITQFIQDDTWTHQHEFYICGNGAMVKSVEALLAEKGIEKTHIFMERFN